MSNVTTGLNDQDVIAKVVQHLSLPFIHRGVLYGYSRVQMM